MHLSAMDMDDTGDEEEEPKNKAAVVPEEVAKKQDNSVDKTLLRFMITEFSDYNVNFHIQ